MATRLMRIAPVFLTVALLASAGCGEDQAEKARNLPGVGDLADADGAEVEIEGVVAMHDGGMAIGGEADPTGYVLQRQNRFDRLYLRMKDDLKSDEVGRFQGRRVLAAGTLGTITVGGTETEQRSFRVLDLHYIIPPPGMGQ